MNIDDEMKFEELSFDNLNLCDKWILNRLNEVIREVDINMDKFEFVNVGSELYNLFGMTSVHGILTYKVTFK